VAIRSTRRERGHAQEAFAARVGLDRSYFGAVERGEFNITMDTLTTIADGLGVRASRESPADQQPTPNPGALMRTLTTTPQRPVGRLRSGAARLLRRSRGIGGTAAFTPLMDAKAASELLGVPASWLLAQARAGRVPHHRLGHYVRFSAEDLREWLAENTIKPGSVRGPAGRGTP
jgi:excisionase family DNA binding protein